MTMKGKLAKLTRVMTIAPVMALALLLILYFVRPEVFKSGFQLGLSIVFLVVLPVLAYPLQPIMPGFKGKGREGQRSLAILTANIGYIAGIIYTLCIDTSQDLLIIYLTYFLSGLLVILFNKGLNVRASGHACGVSGPIAVLVYICGPTALWGILMLAAAYWASIEIKRHTLSELIIGTVMPVVALWLSIRIAALAA